VACQQTSPFIKFLPRSLLEPLLECLISSGCNAARAALRSQRFHRPLYVNQQSTTSFNGHYCTKRMPLVRSRTRGSKSAAPEASRLSNMARNGGRPARRSRQARRPTRVTAAGIDAASMGRRCQGLSKERKKCSPARVVCGHAMRGTARRGLFAARSRRRRAEGRRGTRAEKSPPVSRAVPCDHPTPEAERPTSEAHRETPHATPTHPLTGVRSDVAPSHVFAPFSSGSLPEPRLPDTVFTRCPTPARRHRLLAISHWESS